MTAATSRQPVRRGKRTRLAAKVLIVSLFGFWVQFNFPVILECPLSRAGVLGKPTRSYASATQSGPIGQLFQPDAAGHCERGPQSCKFADAGFAARGNLGHGAKGLAQ